MRSQRILPLGWLMLVSPAAVATARPHDQDALVAVDGALLRLSAQSVQTTVVSTSVLHFPGDAGKPYVCALSVSGYTGGPRLPDGRVIPLRIDDLTLLTAAGSLAPLFTKNIGQLDANGRAISAPVLIVL